MSFAFKRFNFFQPQQVPRHGFPPNASCVVPGGQLLWVGTESGSVSVLDPKLSLLGSFNAHGHKVQEVLWLEQRSLLVTVGVEEPGCSSTTVKLWSGEKVVAAAAAGATGGADGNGNGNGGAAAGGGAGGGPGPAAAAVAVLAALRVTKVFGTHGGVQYPESPVTAAAAAEGGGGSGGSWGGGGGGAAALTVAVGLASGQVVVLTGEVPLQGKARLSHSRRLTARPDAGDAWAVRGLELTGTPDLLSLFVVTESQTLSFNLQTGAKSLLDPLGAPGPRCCCLRPAPGGGGLLTVARQEGLYDYTVDTRAGCTVFEGAKRRLAALGKYLVVVTRDDSGPGAASGPAANLLSSGVGAAGGGGGGGGGGIGGPGNGGGLGGPTAAASSAGGGGGGSSVLQISDVRSKLLAGSFLLTGLQHVFAAWGSLHAVTASGVVWTYREVDLATQLEALLRRSLHKLALDVARQGPGGGEPATLASIHQRWGDHLYAKGEYDAAMAQYLETGGYLEPSYVIRRFLDAQRIHNLTAYLELMHDKGLATCDHTILLLNCYTKLKDVSKLDAFIRRGGVGAAAPPNAGAAADAAAAAAEGEAGGGGGAGGRLRRGRGGYLSSGSGAASASAGGGGNGAAGAAAAGQPPLRFDADTAIRVLRGAGYGAHALAVADAAGQAESVLDILLDDLGEAEEAIEFLRTLPRRRRAELLRRHGRALIALRPEGATGLIMDLCCAPQGAGGEGEAEDGGGPPYVAPVSAFSHLYSGQPTALMLLCEFILNTHTALSAAAAGGAGALGGGGHGSQCDSTSQYGSGAQGGEGGDGGGGGAAAHERLLYHTLLELYLAEHLWEQGEGATEDAKSSGTVDDKKGSESKKKDEGKQPGGGRGAKEEKANGKMKETEGKKAAAGRGGAGAAPAADLDAQARRAKALDLLSRGWAPHAPTPAYDPPHALTLCRLHGFRPGLLLLYDRMRLPGEALQVYMSCGDHGGLIAALLKYGDASRGGEPMLWSEVLDYFVSRHEGGEDCSAWITQVIEHVERRGVLPPLVVLQSLSRSRTLPLSLVRGYVARALRADTEAVAVDAEAAAKLAAETAALREEVTRLRTQPRIFQNARCSASGAPLELPAVHFLCGHSFNARQLMGPGGAGPGGEGEEGEAECPLCGPDQRRVLEIRRSLQAAALQPERFFAQLREAADGWAVVAEHLGRGAMNTAQGQQGLLGQGL